MVIGWRRKHVVTCPPLFGEGSPCHVELRGSRWYWMLQKVLVFVFLDSCSLNFEFLFGEKRIFLQIPSTFWLILPTQPAILVHRRCKPCQPTCQRCPPFACCVPIQGTMHSRPFHRSLHMHRALGACGMDGVNRKVWIEACLR